MKPNKNKQTGREVYLNTRLMGIVRREAENQGKTETQIIDRAITAYGKAMKTKREVDRWK